MERLQKLEEKIKEGGMLTSEEALWLLEEAPFEELCEVAHRITVAYASRKFDMCSIINAKSGRCPENCKWCAQSVHHHTGVEEYGLVSEEECLRQAKMNEDQGVARFSLVTSGRRPSAGEVEKLCKHFEYLRAHSKIELCASLGLATEEQLALVRKYTMQVNDILKKFLAEKKVTLVDFKLEFGVHNGEVLLGDEISPDTCRFWDSDTNEKLDKDRFRRDLGNVEDAYKEMLFRLTGERA